MAEKTPALQARDRLTFLLSLVPFLIDRGQVSVSETAEHFGISEEQVRQAVRLIAVSGIPGVTATYQPDDLFDIAWEEFEENDEIVLTNLIAIDESPRFSSREAAALIAGLQYLSALPERQDRDLISGLLVKLARATSGLPSQVAVADTESNAALAAFKEAVSSGVQVEFDYLNAKGELERRRVDPLRVESVDNDWYLRGWCHLREALRTFRLDRISKIEITKEPLAHHPTELSLPDSLFEESPDDLDVEVELVANAVPLVEDYLAVVKPVGADGSRVRAQIRVSHFHGLKRLVNSRSEVIRVVGPEDAVAAVGDWARQALERYRSDQ